MSNVPAGKQNGFSLVEIMVATVIITFGLLGMAASTGYISAQLRSVTFDVQRRAARQQAVEYLRSNVWTSIATNGTGLTYGNYTVTWAVTLPTQSDKRVALYTSGPAYRARRGARTTVVDTMSVDIAMP
jgi:prepilin-type N-terminal cleavage/methylation domain-containing protein